MYEEDVRSHEPNEDGYRRARFREGWRHAVDAQDYTDETLRKLTWDNLGWRLGKLLGPTDQELVDEMYDLCVRQQKASAAT